MPVRPFSSSIDVLQQAFERGQVVADGTGRYDTVQGAVDSASSWVFVPPGTWNESVTIETQGLHLMGSGYQTVIDGGTELSAVLADSPNVIISNLSTRTDPVDGGRGIYPGADGLVLNCTVRDAGTQGIVSYRDNITISGCRVKSCGDSAIKTGYTAINGCIFGCIVEPGVSGWGIEVDRDDSLVIGNVIRGVGGHGIRVNGYADNILFGNRIHNVGSDGVSLRDDCADTIVANNRISDSGGSDIADPATGTVLDANVTGTAN